MTGEGPVEKILELGWLDAGEIPLTRRDAEKLALPSHATDVSCNFGTETFSTTWRSGDRTLLGEAIQETLQLYAQAGAVLRIERTGDGLELQIIERAESRLRAPTAAKVASESTPPTRNPRRKAARQLRDDRYRLRERGEYKWHGPIGVHAPTLDEFKRNIASGGWDHAALFDLRVAGEKLAAVNDFDELMAVDLARVDHMPHQEATALRALSHMNGRAILADEVGLGKTIEAGLILKELVLRGMAKRILIVCPATLRDQWRQELEEKFDESFEVISSGKQPLRGDRLVMSQMLAARHSTKLTSKKWDLVILDEAHRAAGHARKTQEMLRRLDTRYFLMLTATPVQNNLLELFRLVNLLRPGTFASQSEFKRRFLAGDDLRQPSDPAGLRKLVSDVMIRTTRTQAGLDNVSRYARDHPVKLSKNERRAYSLCTDLLRNVMDGQHDTLRRRQLAHRLTTSPRSLGQTAHNMAQRHPEPRVREVLEQLSDLCIDFGTTSRQQSMLELISEWTADSAKGKVLVFTQHTDTLQDLMRVLGEADVDSVPFHGGMSPNQKAKSIEAFRRKTPVMVSTDSGAEGLNLQFANCVVNYDLPWNPMRIEQRIGRVHRVTQKRDVFVANFFARNTIDEGVYRLLHDKLRMFELLFGQVTTILGEIDTGETSTFESQVMDALVARDDSEMHRRLDELGAKVDAAYNSAQEMLAAGGSINSWYGDMSYRKNLKSGTELMPKVIKQRKRQRQKDVETFARTFLEQVGGEIIHDTRHLVSASVPPTIAETLGGRSKLHLAFSPDGLTHHPDAELCAVGSEIFEELVLSLKESGDLHALLPDPPEPGKEAWCTHSPAVRLVAREVVGPKDWRAQAVWRVRSDGHALGDDIVTTEIGDWTEPPTSDLVEVAPLCALPTTLPSPSALVDGVVRGSLPLLREVQRELQEGVDAKEGAERDRMVAHYTTLIEEREISLDAARAPSRRKDFATEIRQLQFARDKLARAGRSNAEVRADLLAVRFEARPPFAVRETWTSRTGATTQLECTWQPGQRDAEYPQLAEAGIENFDLCDSNHVCDADDIAECEGCGKRCCDRCEAASAIDACPSCWMQLCGECRPGPRDRCERCATPERASDLDTDWGVGWRLGFGATLIVGTEAAIWTDAKGDSLTLLRGPDDELDVRERAHLFGLSLGGAPGAQVLGRQPLLAPDVPENAIGYVETIEVSWTVKSGSNRPDGPLIDEVPEVDQEDVTSSEDFYDMADILRNLREAVKPPPAPSLNSTAVRIARWYELTGHGVEQVEMLQGQEGAAHERHVLNFESSNDDVADVVAVARSHSACFTLRALNASYLLEFQSPDAPASRWLVAGDEGATAESESALVQFASQMNPPVDRALLVPEQPAELADDFACPTHAELVERQLQTRWVPDPGTPAGRVPTSEDLELLGLSPYPCAADLLPPRLNRAFLTLAQSLDRRAAPATLQRSTVVTETWRGSGTRVDSYLVAPGQPARPRLDDTFETADDFQVDHAGHLHEVGAGWTCVACRQELCRACGPSRALGQCSTCRRDTCGTCRSGEHEKIPTEHCARCDGRSCPDCGVTIDVATCATCRREICASCRSDSQCKTCAGLLPASAEEIDALPSALHAHDTTVRLAHDAGATVATLVGVNRREIAVVTDGEIVTWRSISDESSRELTTRFGPVVGLCGDSDATIVWDDPQPPESRSDDPAILSEQIRSVLNWSYSPRAGRSPRTATEATRIGPDETLKHAFHAVQARGEPATPEPLSQTSPKSRDANARSYLLQLDAIDAMLPAASDPTDRGVITISRQWHLTLTELTASGLNVLRRRGDQVEQVEHKWDAIAIGVTNPFSDWDPQPDALLRTAHDDVIAHLARFGVHAFLHTYTPGDEKFVRLDRLDGYPNDVRLASFLGFPERDVQVATALTPTMVVPVEVSNAHLVRREVKPLVEHTDANPSPEALDVAVRFWVAGSAESSWGAKRSRDTADQSSKTNPPQLNREAIGEELAFGLLACLQLGGADASTRPTIHLGVRAEQTCRSPYGEVQVVAESKRTSQWLLTRALDTGRLVNSVIADRDGHLVESAQSCTYCNEVTCAMCADAVRLCRICSIQVCRRCASLELDQSLCRACASLKKPKWRDRRRESSAGKTLVLAGNDARHEVALFTTQAEIILQLGVENGASSDYRLVPDPEVRAWIEARLGSSLPRPT